MSYFSFEPTDELCISLGISVNERGRFVVYICAQTMLDFAVYLQHVLPGLVDQALADGPLGCSDEELELIARVVIAARCTRGNAAHKYLVAPKFFTWDSKTNLYRHDYKLKMKEEYKRKRPVNSTTLDMPLLIKRLRPDTPVVESMAAEDTMPVAESMAAGNTILDLPRPILQGHIIPWVLVATCYYDSCTWNNNQDIVQNLYYISRTCRAFAHLLFINPTIRVLLAFVCRPPASIWKMTNSIAASTCPLCSATVSTSKDGKYRWLLYHRGFLYPRHKSCKQRAEAGREILWIDAKGNRGAPVIPEAISACSDPSETGYGISTNMQDILQDYSVHASSLIPRAILAAAFVTATHLH